MWNDSQDWPATCRIALRDGSHDEITDVAIGWQHTHMWWSQIAGWRMSCKWCKVLWRSDFWYFLVPPSPHIQAAGFLWWRRPCLKWYTIPYIYVRSKAGDIISLV